MTTVPKTYPARVQTTQQINYFRKTINWNDANIAAPTDPFGRLPAGAQITSCLVDIETAFNAGTTNVLTVGTTTTANEIVAAGDVDETAVAATVVTRPLGGSLCRSAEQNLYAKFAQTGTAATAGKAHVCIGFIPDNDG